MTSMSQFTFPGISDKESPQQKSIRSSDETLSKKCPHDGRYSNTSSYSWIGNHWRPPTDVPLYSPDDMRNIFSKERTLWIGDSTARQDYVTLYNVVKSSTPFNVAVSELEYGINVNKGRVTEPCQPDGNGTHILPSGLSLCRRIDDRGGNVGDRNVTAASSTTTTTAHGSNYDWSPLMCLRDAMNYTLENKQMLIDNYSTIIFSLGIWEVIRPYDCGKKDETYVLEVLDTIQRELAEGGNLNIVWKVHVGSGNENHFQKKKGAAVQQWTREWFTKSQQQTNLTNNMRMVDLAKELEARTYGSSRIQGDLQPHVGPAARTLLLQMVTHAMIQQKECTSVTDSRA